ncbi:POK6 protein, partial [Rhinoptilus africanus]|nr:POK6 protein [Rhinoptilus africanus]
CNSSWILRPKRREQPLTNAITVFTDAGRRSRRAAATWCEDSQWKSKLLSATAGDSLQTLELAAVVWAFKEWINQELNIVSDSLYVVGIVTRIEDARIKELHNERLFELLR